MLIHRKDCLVFAIMITILVSCFNLTHGQESYEEWLKNQQAEYLAYKEEVTRQYREYVRQDSLAFESFKQLVLQKWDKFESSTDKDWVEYDNTLDSRAVVDFENGQVQVEVLVPEEEAEDNTTVQNRMKESVRWLLENRGKTMDYEVSGQQPVALRETPILKDMVALPEGEDNLQNNTAKMAGELVKQHGITTKVVDSKDGIKRVKGTVLFSLVPDHLRIRAERYLDDVRETASKFQLDPRLVFAVMHTESWFNPKAKSSAPAYGLMQLVPNSGGRDAYLFLYGEDIVPSPNYLYNPKSNIELGCAYLHILGTKYFQDVKDETVKRYCIISAYNTGAGNVSRAITSKRDLSGAIRRLNSMEYDEAYNVLITRLPYDETKNYLAKVEERIPIYNEWGN